MKVLVVTNMYPSTERPHWGAFVRSQVESLELLGVSVDIYEIEGWRSTWNYWRALRELPAVARRVRADLVHAHFGLSGAAAMQVSDQPLVVSFCGDDLLGRPNTRGRTTSKSRVLVRLSYVVARRADAVIVKSEEMRRRIPGVEQVDVIPNGVDLERFVPLACDEARARLGWSAEGHVVLFVGQPNEPRKNWPFAREVESRLLARGHDVRLVAIHDRTQDEVVLAMNAADALLLPSYHEGSPNAVKEAMAVGLPVVAAPVGDCVERLRGCWPGAVVQRDAASFADATEAVLMADSRSNGRECIAPLEFSAVASRVLDVYKRVLGSRHEAAEMRQTGTPA